MKPLTQAEIDVLAPFTANPHPDGKPWDKCCGVKGDTECMCFTRKPKNAPSRFDQVFKANMRFWWPSENAIKTVKALLAENGRFMCCHRKTEDGYNRECAGWAAKLRGQSCDSKQGTSILRKMLSHLR